jgi:hypothetical protein
MKFEITRASAGLRPHRRPIEIATLEEGDGGQPIWVVELSSIDDLLDLRAHAQSDLVISASYSGDRLPGIIIYDDYME